MSVILKDTFPVNILPRPGYVLTFPYVNEYHQIREYTKEQILAFRATENQNNLHHSYRNGNII